VNRKHITLFILAMFFAQKTYIYPMYTRGARITKPTVHKKVIRQPQKRPIQTRPQQLPSATPSTELVVATATTTRIPTQKAASTWLPSNVSNNLWSYWTALKNKIFGTKTTPQIATLPTFPVARKATPQSPTTFARIDAIQSLPEAESVLKNATKAALNNVKTKTGIPDAQWTDLIEKERKFINYIQENCFSQADPDAQWDTDIPEEISKKITLFLLSKNINPEGISVRYRDTIDIDPFGHDTISVVGPTILYKSDMQGDKSIITGYTPATITLHKQNIAKLTENQFEAKLQHTLMHLKQAHNEQINLLNKTIGTEKYAQYVEPYKQALEREADFLEPIKSAKVAKIVQRAFLDEALDVALKEIKNTREKLGIQNTQTGLMVCAPPGELPQFLLDMKSFDDIKKYIYEKKEAIAREFFEGDEELLEIWRQENSESGIEKLQNLYYKDPKPNVVDDKDVPIIFRTITKELLKNTGIDPHNINIISKKNFEKITGNHFSKYVNGYAKGPIKYQKKNFNYIALNEDLLINAPLNVITTTIAHEIGHLLRMHAYTRVSLGHIYITKFPYFSIEEKGYRILLEKNLIQQLNAIEELEADITYAMLHPEIAKTILTHSLSSVATGTLSNANITRSRFGIHTGINILYHWIKKIVELHQNKAAESIKAQPLFAAHTLLEQE
jgi:hypothetical protein